MEDCYMKNYYVSDYWNEGIKGHSNYSFVDVAVNDDNLLFIDPVLLETAHDAWCQEANESVQSFFDVFYETYRTNNRAKKEELLSHASEQNGTRLGYGRGDNGKGNTKKGLLNIFAPLDSLSNDISTIKKAEDLAVLIPDFAEDGLSDLLTNILHNQLNQFTYAQMKKYGIESNSVLSFWTWDKENLCWKKIERSAYCINNKELLVVPKHIVRKKYLFSISQYFNRIILERIREDGGYMNDGRPIPKKDIVRAKRYSGKHWQYDEAVSYTKKNNDALNEYHQKLPVFYNEHGCPLENEKLDELVYGCPVSQTA